MRKERAPLESEWERKRREKGKAPAVEEGEEPPQLPPAGDDVPAGGAAAFKALAQRAVGSREIGETIDALVVPAAPGGAPPTEAGLRALPGTPRPPQRGARASAGSEVELGSMGGSMHSGSSWRSSRAPSFNSSRASSFNSRGTAAQEDAAHGCSSSGLAHGDGAPGCSKWAAGSSAAAARWEEVDLEQPGPSSRPSPA